MLKIAFAAAALALYFAAGMVTWAPTAARLAHACEPLPPTGAHVVLWPISYGLSAGLKSRC